MQRKKQNPQDFPSGPGVKNPPGNAGDVGSIPGWGRGSRIPRMYATATEAGTPYLESLRASKHPTGREEDPECCT